MLILEKDMVFYEGTYLARICTSLFEFRIEGRIAALGDRDLFANFETRQ
jgi:hypothetical protein